MASERDLQAIRELLAGGFVSVAELDEACRLAAGSLGADGLALTVSLPGTLRAVIGASSDTARLLEQAQLTVAEGPCTVAAWSGKPVFCADLADPAETRWSMLVRYVAELPVRAVTAVPLVLNGGLSGGRTMGSLDAYSTRPHGLDHLDLDRLVGLSAVLSAAALRLRAPEAEAAGEAGKPWEGVHQATGMVIAALGLTALDALDRLRARAFCEGRLLTEIAADVVSGAQPADLSESAG